MPSKRFSNFEIYQGEKRQAITNSSEDVIPTNSDSQMEFGGDWFRKMPDDKKKEFSHGIETLKNLRNYRNNNGASLPLEERQAWTIVLTIYRDHRHVDCNTEACIGTMHLQEDFVVDNDGGKRGHWFGIRVHKDSLALYNKAALETLLNSHWMHKDMSMRNRITTEIIKKYDVNNEDHQKANINGFIEILTRPKNNDPGYYFEEFDPKTFNRDRNGNVVPVRCGFYGDSGSAKTANMRAILMKCEFMFDLYIIVLPNSTHINNFDYIDENKRKVYYFDDHGTPNQRKKQKRERWFS